MLHSGFVMRYESRTTFFHCLSLIQSMFCELHPSLKGVVYRLVFPCVLSSSSSSQMYIFVFIPYQATEVTSDACSQSRTSVEERIVWKREEDMCGNKLD